MKIKTKYTERNECVRMEWDILQSENVDDNNKLCLWIWISSSFFSVDVDVQKMRTLTFMAK